ncbi:uncharacterized protein LOC111909102 [Lactuca sativa]|uniref:uncharacterized protein LOC111909102 n=1 Tax=Lactuca sativa TaxID=4236 RepID=UPI0022AF3806|nr:uncharacterized protein LOC111909102 [Lactuca sativa]
MSYNEFVGFLERFTQEKCEKLYYCQPDLQIPEGLTLLSNELQYQEFIDIAYRCGVQVPVYIDHFGTIVHVTKANENENEDNYSVKSNMSIEGEEGINLTDFMSPQQSNMKGVTYERVSQANGNEDATEGDPNFDEDENIPDVKGKQMFNEDISWKKQFPILVKRLLVKCSDGQCTFRLWASWMSEEHSFQIKSLIIEHNCARNFKLGSIVNYRWIGSHFTREVLENQKFNVRMLKEEVKTKFGIEVSMEQCRRAKQHVMALVEGTIVENYAKLWSYGEEIKRSNPGSTVKLSMNSMPDGKTYFSRIYICFHALKEGWRSSCRGIINLDGCFLKATCTGQLLRVVGRDGNNHIYPIVWVVVCVENKDNWKWFLENLQEDLHLEGGFGKTLM